MVDYKLNDGFRNSLAVKDASISFKDFGIITFFDYAA